MTVEARFASAFVSCAHSGIAHRVRRTLAPLVGALIKCVVVLPLVRGAQIVQLKVGRSTLLGYTVGSIIGRGGKGEPHVRLEGTI